jgi:hypothetical protein
VADALEKGGYCSREWVRPDAARLRDVRGSGGDPPARIVREREPPAPDALESVQWRVDHALAK